MRYQSLVLAATFILATNHTHAQWEIEDSHTTASLRGIHNVGGGVAWASGTGGTVLRTIDDGKTWQTCPVPLAGTKDSAEKLDFRGIQAFDAQTSIVMSSGPGDLSRLYKTTDGCQTWKLLFTNPDKDGFWDALQIGPDDSDGGIVIGDPVNGTFVIYETHDQGESWQPWGQNKYHVVGAERTHPTLAMKDESLFAASNSSADLLGRNFFYFVTGGRGGSRILASHPRIPFEAEMTYKFTALELPFNPSKSGGAFSIADRIFANESYVDLMIVGGDYSTPNAPGSAVYVPHREAFRNGVFMGEQRMIAAETPPHGYRSAVAYDPTTKTWITVGPNGTDISTDDGRNWRALTPSSLDEKDADKNWNALSLPFVVGPKGRVGKLRPTALGAVTPSRQVKP